MGVRTTFAAFAVCAAWAGSLFAITIATVPIGNPGNPADMRNTDTQHPSGVGSVSYAFNIGQTEVTNAQYVAFLNAVAASDPYGLFDPKMASSTVGGIVRSGATGSYTYQIKSAGLNGAYAYDTKPVVYVTWDDTIRFANWMNNRQPTGSENASTTEDGAYFINGATSVTALAAVTRNAGARWWLPSENEWYKAAYHKNDGVTNNYWNIPTSSDSVPNNNPPASDTGNSVNWHFQSSNHEYTTGNSAFPLTDVGAYTLSDGPYGTYDQGGNVYEWSDTPSGITRIFRGGSWLDDWTDLRAQQYVWGNTTAVSGDIGFRVASLEPTGDFNGNGTVDAADYVLWRQKHGTASDYKLWRAHFGESVAGSGASIESVIVPEPTTAGLLVIGIVVLANFRRPTSHNRA